MSPLLLMALASEPLAAPGTASKAKFPAEYTKAVALKLASNEVPTTWPALLIPNPAAPVGAGWVDGGEY